MKKYQIQVATLLVVVTTLFTGCDKAEKVIEYPAGGLVQFVAKAATGYPDTRIGYSEEGNKMNYTWGELNSERFSVFVPNSNIKHDFSLKGGAHSRNGRFEGQIPEGATTTFATYPGLNGNPATLTAITHDLSNQGLYTTPNALFGNRHHLMWATAEANNGEVDYQFTHKVSMLKLELAFTGVTSKIRSVSIYGAHNKANLNGTNGVLSYETADKGVITASDATGFDLVDNVLTAYVYLFPEDLSGTRLSITATDASGKEYTSGAFNGRVLNGGTVYRLSKGMSDSGYIVVENLKWAKGNLIADGPNGARIGAPEDGGLFFQFGSLVGWSGSGNDDGTGRGDGRLLSVQIKPATCSITTWSGSWTGDPIFDDPTNGIGDPCRYYLGDPWRLPTIVELNGLFGFEPTYEGYISWSDTLITNWEKLGTYDYASTDSRASYIPADLQLSASGSRDASEGRIMDVGRVGLYWSSTLKNGVSTAATRLYFSSNYIASGYNSRSTGYSVRCVRD